MSLEQKSEDFKIRLELGVLFRIFDHTLTVSSDIFLKLFREPNVKIDLFKAGVSLNIL